MSILYQDLVFSYHQQVLPQKISLFFPLGLVPMQRPVGVRREVRLLRCRQPPQIPVDGVISTHHVFFLSTVGYHFSLGVFDYDYCSRNDDTRERF